MTVFWFWELILTECSFDSLAQEPFTKIPVIWVINDDTLGRRLGEYKLAASTGLISDWKRSFQRADVMVFPDYALPVRYMSSSLYYQNLILL